MADFNALETLINAYIKQNGVQAITGQVLNGVLRGMVSALGKGWTIAGDAEPNTDPGTMTGPVAYIAHTAGTYANFGNLVVNDGEVAFLKYNEQTWTKEVLASLAATASVDGNVGTPSVTTSFVNGVLNFAFQNLKGNPGQDGQDGAAAGFGTVAATVDNTIGTPAVSVSASGPDTAKNFTFAFTGLKGATGVTSAVVTVDNTSGTPQCAVSLVGQELHLDFTGLKGAQGDTGSSVAYPFTIVNNVTTNDATQALSAAMGVQLESEISQLDLKVDNNEILLEKGLQYKSTPTITTVTKLQLKGNGKYNAVTSNSLKIRYIPVTKGDFVRIKGTDATATNLRYALSAEIPADQVGVGDETLLNGTSVDVFYEVRYSGYVGVYSTGFADLAFTINEKTELGIETSADTSKVKLMLNALGITGCEEVKYVVFNSGFVYYDDGTTASSDSLKYTNNRLTEGKKYLFYSQNVNTGTGRAGLAFYDANGDYVSGVRQVTGATANGFRADVVEIPATATSFRTTLNNDCIGNWFAFLTDNDKILQYEEPINQEPDTTREDVKYIMRLLGITDYSEVIPSGWYVGKFVYYDNGNTANLSGLNYTYKCYTSGKKYLVFTQNVNTGTGRAGLAFYDENDVYISGVRQFIGASVAGCRVLGVEIPSGASYFRATINDGSKDDFFAYVTDDEKALKYANIEDDSIHLKICLLGNSYTADAWRYVPAMLLSYGITCEVNFYYRGSGSLQDLDDQWTHTSQYDIANYDGTQHIRLHFTIDSRKGVSWANATRTSAQAIVAADKYDIISVQQDSRQAMTASSYVPYLQDVIDKILAECDYPFTLCLFTAYTRADDDRHEASLAQQEIVYNTYPFNMVMSCAAAVFSAQENDTLAVLGDSTYHNMYASDNIHLQEGLPCYVVACTIVQSILGKYLPGKSVLGDQFRATAENIADLGMDATANGDSTGVTDANCYLAQKAAISAVKNPFEIIEV